MRWKPGSIPGGAIGDLMMNCHTKPESELLTIREVALILACSPNTVRTMIRQERITPEDVIRLTKGGQVRIRRDAVKRILNYSAPVFPDIKRYELTELTRQNRQKYAEEDAAAGIKYL